MVLRARVYVIVTQYLLESYFELFYVVTISIIKSIHTNLNCLPQYFHKKINSKNIIEYIKNINIMLKKKKNAYTRICQISEKPRSMLKYAK